MEIPKLFQGWSIYLTKHQCFSKNLELDEYEKQIITFISRNKQPFILLTEIG
jgi:hypothetical protein